MISFPSLVTLAPAEFLYGESGCGVASRSRTSRLLWWGLGSGLVFEFCRVSQPQLGSPPEKKKKLFTRDTARNYRAKLTSCLGEKQDPAPSRGTRKTSSARAEGAGRGRPPRAAGPGRPARPALPTVTEPSRRGHRRRRDVGRTLAALGRHLLLSAAAPRAGRRGYCLDSACRALRPRRRLDPEPRGRAGSMAAPSPGCPSGRPSFWPSLSAFPTCPRTLFASLSRFPAAGPSLPSSSAPAVVAPPGSAGGGGGRRLRLLTSSRGRGRGRGCVPRRRATFTRARDCEGRGREGRREGEERKEEEGGWGGGELLPHRPPRLRRHRPRRGSAAGAGRPPAGCTPTAGSWAGGRREPVTARGGGAGRRRRRQGATGRGWGRGGGAGGGRGFACEAPREARSCPGRGRPVCCSPAA